MPAACVSLPSTASRSRHREGQYCQDTCSVDLQLSTRLSRFWRQTRSNWPIGLSLMMQGRFVEECQYIGVASGVDSAAQVDELIDDLHGVRGVQGYSIDCPWGCPRSINGPNNNVPVD